MELVHLNSVKSLPPCSFVLGGAASGKSLVAETLMENSGLELVYVATGQIFDDETKSRVAVHRDRRDARWTTVEAPIDVSGEMLRAREGQALLIDCATMWLTNLLMEDRDIPAAEAQFLQGLQTCAAPVVIVSNEVGQGIVPENTLARRFRNIQGRFNMALAAHADVVVHVVAGLPMALKGRFA